MPKFAQQTFAAISCILSLMLVTSNAADHASHHHHHDDHAHHAAENVITTTKSGNWSSKETWTNGKVPGEGDRVVIRQAHDVVYDVDSTAVIRGIQIAGALTFAHDRDTRLEAGLIRIESNENYCEEGFDCSVSMSAEPDAKGPGPIEKQPQTESRKATLQVGRPDAPIPSEHRAIIRLHYIEGMDPKNCPGIICCGGRMDFHGSPLEKTWVKLPYQTAKVGEARIVMPYPLPGWKEGDRIIVSGTTRQFGYIGTRNRKGGEDNSVGDNPTTEERVITSMRRWGAFDSNLQIVSFKEPLRFDHLGQGEYRAEVANLSRNVIVESANPEGVRGHTMYHADSAGSISYAEFRHLGKRDELGKYPIHYHLVGDTMRGSSLIGLSVWDSHNRWITIHGTQFLVVKDCIGYKSIGHGYFLEDGTEVYNIFDRNLAVQALGGKPLPNQVLPFDGNLGSGYWWSNSLNTFTRNVAAECDEDGFRLEVVNRYDFDTNLPILTSSGNIEKIDIRTLPFVRFDGNEAHCQRLFGLNLGGFPGGNAKKDSDVEGVGPDYAHPFHIRNTKIWNTHWAFHAGSPCVLIEDMDLNDCAYGLWRCVMHRHEYRRINFNNVNTTVFFPRASGESDYSYTTKDYFDLEPKDDLPPVTVITDVRPLSSSMVRVHGFTTDNYNIQKVTVNDQPVRTLDNNFAEWEIDLPTGTEPTLKLTAISLDQQGNLEKMPHTVIHHNSQPTPDQKSERVADVK